jgi:hypothetical protein
MQYWLLLKLKRGGAIVVDEFHGSLAALLAEINACPFGAALRFPSTYHLAVYGTAYLAATTRNSRRAAKTLSHYVTNTTHIARHQRFIGDAHLLARECGMPGRAHTPRDLLYHVINALEALAPPSLRPLQRADFVFGALLMPAAAPQVAIAPAAAFAAAGAAAGYDSEATIADSIATLRDD